MGRPCKYKSPEQLQAKVDEYFATHKIPTVCGLSLHLGFLDFHSLLDYGGRRQKNELGGNRRAFIPIIARAKQRICEYREELLGRERGSLQGIIHGLRVMGYDAPQQIDQTIKGERKIVYWKERKKGRKDKKK